MDLHSLKPEELDVVKDQEEVVPLLEVTKEPSLDLDISPREDLKVDKCQFKCVFQKEDSRTSTELTMLP